MRGGVSNGMRPSSQPLRLGTRDIFTSTWTACLHQSCLRMSSKIHSKPPLWANTLWTMPRSLSSKSGRRPKYASRAVSKSQPMMRAMQKMTNAPLRCRPRKQCTKTFSPCRRALKTILTACSSLAGHVMPFICPRCPMLSHIRTQNGWKGESSL